MATKQQSINFEWHLSEKQREFFEADARFRVGMMGRRFGKNEVGSACIIDYCTQPQKYSFGSDDKPISWWIGPTYRQSYLYGFLKVREKLPDTLVNDDETRGSEWGPSKITLWDGRTIEFLSYGNPSGLQGAGVDLIVGDEWAYSDESLWNNDLRPMLMDSGGGAVFISKPLGENHFHEKYNWGQLDEYPEWYSLHATSYDNPTIPNSEINKAKRTTPESVFRQEYLADPQAGGTLLTLDMLDTEPAGVLDDQQWKWHIAVDIGVTMDKKKAREDDTDYWACAIVAEHWRKPFAYLCEVARERGQTPAQAAEWLATVTGWVPTNKVKIESVQAQRWFQTDAKNAGLQPIPYEPQTAKKDRITYLSVPFSNGNVKLLDWADVQGKSVDWSDFRTEWAGFPNAKHDDQLDVVAMALEEVNFQGELSAMGTDMYGRT